MPMAALTVASSCVWVRCVSPSVPDALSTPPDAENSAFGLLGVAAVPAMYAAELPASNATALADDATGELPLKFKVAISFAVLFAPACRFCSFSCETFGEVLPSRDRNATLSLPLNEVPEVVTVLLWMYATVVAVSLAFEPARTSMPAVAPWKPAPVPPLFTSAMVLFAMMMFRVGEWLAPPSP